jgi:hypothetical protein
VREERRREGRERRREKRGEGEERRREEKRGEEKRREEKEGYCLLIEICFVLYIYLTYIYFFMQR